MVSPNNAVSLRIRSVSKAYPGVQALEVVDLDVMAGEIHALVGGNGSGKSTLLKIVGGAIMSDSGSVELLGIRMTASHPAQARRVGVATVFQDHSLVPDLTVAQNLFLGASPDDRPRLRDVGRWAAEKIAESGLTTVDPDALLLGLSAAQWQHIEITKALLSRPKVLLLDEPTTALGAEEIDRLHEVIAGTAALGTAVVYVSHRLREVLEFSNRVSVIRDGRMQGTYPAADLSEKEILPLMIGAPVEVEFAPKTSRRGDEEPVLRVEAVAGSGFGPVSFALRRGEILGLAGAEGNGQREFLRALAGAQRSRGDVHLAGKPVGHSSPADALRGGVMFISGDRARESILASLGVAHNMLVQVVGRLGRHGFLSGASERRTALSLVDRLEIVTSSLNKPIGELSGGNQQKAVMARTLVYPAQVICIDEPTSGVDAKARLDIYAALRSRAADGLSLILNSADAAELAGLCDRVLVFSRGRVVRELEEDSLTEAGIIGSFVAADSRRSSSLNGGGEGLASTPRSLFGRASRGGWLPIAVLGILLVLLATYATARAPLFLSGQNLRYVILTALPMIALGGGQLCVLLVGGFDISVAANLSLATGLLTVLAAGTLSPSLAIPGVLAVLAVGTLIGLGNGSFVKLVRINPLVATMAMMSLLQGVALFVRPVYGGTVHTAVVDALGIKVGFVPVVFIILVAAAALAEMWLRRSGDGLRTRATGLHEEAARRNGVATSRLQLRAYALCGTLAAFAGLLLASQTGIGDPRAGDSLLLVSFTAPFLAGASLFGGRGSFVGTVLAALFLAAILNAFTLMEVPRPIGVIISGALTLLAIALYSGRSWRMGRSVPA